MGIQKYDVTASVTVSLNSLKNLNGPQKELLVFAKKNGFYIVLSVILERENVD